METTPLTPESIGLVSMLVTFDDTLSKNLQDQRYTDFELLRCEAYAKSDMHYLKRGDRLFVARNRESYILDQHDGGTRKLSQEKRGFRALCQSKVRLAMRLSSILTLAYCASERCREISSWGRDGAMSDPAHNFSKRNTSSEYNSNFSNDIRNVSFAEASALSAFHYCYYPPELDPFQEMKILLNLKKLAGNYLRASIILKGAEGEIEDDELTDIVLKAANRSINERIVNLIVQMERFKAASPIWEGNCEKFSYNLFNK